MQRTFEQHVTDIRPYMLESEVITRQQNGDLVVAIKEENINGKDHYVLRWYEKEGVPAYAKEQYAEFDTLVNRMTEVSDTWYSHSL